MGYITILRALNTLSHLTFKITLRIRDYNYLFLQMIRLILEEV